jgi:hypothetical protein
MTTAADAPGPAAQLPGEQMQGTSAGPIEDLIEDFTKDLNKNTTADLSQTLAGHLAEGAIADDMDDLSPSIARAADLQRASGALAALTRLRNVLV